ncbi:CRISPR-associated endonuclease Cas2 [Psychrobacter urativorans]|uniref:CRISPR-associated endoribonuclease Cas2 n=1 Tax=Psychrobacter urativorans TaxID=45610 RepID=A0A0M4SVV1_9GAMM|nr:CRISPR-associated endonuclease Cas2 [Psychrobacter urativorans]ALF58810.1 hypothetical protein AOC03_01045 [Psychrobacter urativorans]
MSKICFIIAYDISNNKRLQRLQRTVSSHFFQLQYSIYYGTMTRQRMDAFIITMQQIIHPTDDDLRIYEVEPLEQAFVIGKHNDDIMMFSERGQLKL